MLKLHVQRLFTNTCVWNRRSSCPVCLQNKE